MYPRTLGTRFTEEDFLALPESHDRIELLDGEVILSPSPTYRHQRLVLELATALRGWAAAHAPAAVGLSPLDVRFAPNRVLQPDIFVLAAGIDEGAEGPIAAVPDLVVEVLSSNRSYDRMTKRLVYADAGVGEYWVVDPELRAIEQIRDLETLATITEGQITCRALAGLQLDVSVLFA